MAMLQKSGYPKSGLLPTMKAVHAKQASCQCACMYCGKIRVAPRVWKSGKAVQKSRLSHSACPECYRKEVAHLFEEINELYGVVVTD